MGGFDISLKRPSLPMKMQDSIFLTPVKSSEKHDRVENCALLMMVPKISVAPKLASRKSQPRRFEYDRQVLYRAAPANFAPLR